MELGEILATILIPLIIGPIFIYFKSLNDKSKNEISERKLIKFNDVIERVKNKLKHFYWPTYLKLLYIYQLNFNIPYEEKENNSKMLITSSNSSMSSDEENNIKFTKKKLKRCKNYIDKNNKVFKCNKYIPINSQHICRKCMWAQKKKNSITISIPQDIDVDNTESSITGNGYGNVSNLTKDKIMLNENSFVEFENMINNTYDDLLNIIETNISIAEPNGKIGKQIVLFVKFIKLKKLLNKNEFNNLSKLKDNTNKLLSLIELKLFDLQKQYHVLLKNGPYVSDSSDESE